jgi:hypothetical protein
VVIDQVNESQPVCPLCGTDPNDPNDSWPDPLDHPDGRIAWEYMRDFLNGMLLTDRITIRQRGIKAAAAFSMTGLAIADPLGSNLAPAWDPVKTVDDFFSDKKLNYIDQHKESPDRTCH